jgi:hypothetical protein
MLCFLERFADSPGGMHAKIKSNKNQLPAGFRPARSFIILGRMIMRGALFIDFFHQTFTNQNLTIIIRVFTAQFSIKRERPDARIFPNQLKHRG